MEKLGFGRALKNGKSAQRKVEAYSRKAQSLEKAIEGEISYVIPDQNGNGDIRRYFSVLGIKPTKDKEKIRNAYINKAKESHPDINKSLNSESIMKELNEAYSFLTNKGIRIEESINLEKSVVAIERLSIELYIKLRTSDYERMVGMARRGVNRNELAALIDEFCDWNKRFYKVEKVIVGRLDKRIKALEKHKNKCQKLLSILEPDDTANISNINLCINRINETLNNAYTFRSYANTAFSKAKARLAPFETEQANKLKASVE